MSIDLDAKDTVAVLTLNRPPVNALDEAALHELSEAVCQIETDPAIQAVLIISAVPGIFCAGGDLKYWPRHYAHEAQTVSAAGRKVFAQIEALTKPSIAAVAGYVIGDGLSLALACDLRLAEPDVTFHLPEVSYGFIPGWGTIHRLVQAVGSSVAAEMLLLGEPLDAQRAHTVGLVNRLTATDDLMPAAHTLATAMAAKPRLAFQYAKAALRGNPDHLADQGAWEAACFEAVWGRQ